MIQLLDLVDRFQWVLDIKLTQFSSADGYTLSTSVFFIFDDAFSQIKAEGCIIL